MTKFNPHNKEVLTFGEALGPAMNITEQDDADQYFKDYVSYQNRMLEKEPRTDRLTAEDICKTNLGYYAGYGSEEMRKRVERLFRCSHPIFDSVESKGTPYVGKALSMGKIAAIHSKNN